MTSTTDILTLQLLPGETWWGGAVADGQRMPFGAEPHRRNLATSAGFLSDDTAGANQSAPLLLSDRGRVVWSENPFTFTFRDGSLTVEGSGIVADRAGDTLGEAFRHASSTWFPPSGGAPAEAMFTGPQYNTWIEMPYAPTQQGVLDYVRGLLDAGFPPGLVIIDDSWSPGYGTWSFDLARFPDPGAMIRQLGEWGCTVMLWIVPFISADSATFRQLRERNLLVRGPTGLSRSAPGGTATARCSTPPTRMPWPGLTNDCAP